MLIEKLDYKFDFDLIKADVLSILEEHNFITQIGLTHSSRIMTEDEKILESVGSIKDYETGKFKFKETDFVNFNERYKHTYLYEMYKSLPNLGRCRIMTMYGPKCYTFHRDMSKRYHYVIETNLNCLFLFPQRNAQYHIPADKTLYIVDTRYRHSFINGSRERRIHLVFDDLSTLQQREL
jgi:hypothetical protein